MTRTWFTIYCRDMVIGHLDDLVGWYLDRQAEELKKPVHEYYATQSLTRIHPVTIFSFILTTLNMLVLVTILKKATVAKILIGMVTNVAACVAAVVYKRKYVATYEDVAKINGYLGALLFPARDT